MSWKRRLLDLGADEARALLDRFAVKSRVRRDNPGGEWLAAQRQRAAAQGDRIGGAITAYTVKPAKVSPYALQFIRGQNAERRVPGDMQYDSLRPLMEQHGYDFQYPILLGVNHRGDPRIIEGNTRAAVARDLGIDRIPAEIRWFAGGEQAGDYPGGLTPNNLLENLYDPSGVYRRLYERRTRKARGGLAVKPKRKKR